MSFSTLDLLHGPGRHELDVRLARMIRDREHSAADALLRDLLLTLPTELSDLCLSLPAAAVQVQGWEQLAARAAEVSAQAGEVTAVGVDLTSQPVELDANGCHVQQLETNYYTDDAYPFSTSSGDEILANCDRGGSPWHGEFADVDQALTIRGLNALNEKILQSGNGGAINAHDGATRADSAVLLLAEWFRHLRFHQAALRALDEYGTWKAIPLLVGTNEVGPSLEAVYYPPKPARVALLQPSPSDADVLRKAQAYARQTEKDIEQIRSTRAYLRGSQWKGNESGYEAAQEQAKQHENINVRHSPAMQEFGYCHELSEEEFELYLEAYREQREAYRTKSPLPVARPAPSTDPSVSFRRVRSLYRRKLFGTRGTRL